MVLEKGHIHKLANGQETSPGVNAGIAIHYHYLPDGTRTGVAPTGENHEHSYDEHLKKTVGTISVPIE